MALHSGLPFTLCFLQPGIGQGRRRRNGEQRMWRRGKEEKEEKGGGLYPEPGVIYHRVSGLSSDLGSRPYSPWETKDLSVRDGVFQNTHKETLIHPVHG